jgi:hypothetical protein
VVVVKGKEQKNSSQEVIRGGKESRAGVFEDDEEDIPIVKEIEYIESPKKKKDKSEKKKRHESPDKL